MLYWQAKEYTASLDAYALAIELYSGSSLAFGNRAAANIKVGNLRHITGSWKKKPGNYMCAWLECDFGADT